MLWIGLTGGIGTGKSTVANLFEGLGVPVADADKIVHELYQPGSECLQKISQAFGPDFVLRNGSLDRQRLAEIIFKNPELRYKLEQIVHPLVQARVQDFRESCAQQGHHYAIYDVPLLFEKKLQSQFNGIIVIGCSDDVRTDRLVRNRAMSREDIQRRIVTQTDLAFKKKNADWYIDNSGTLLELEQKVGEVHELILQISS